MRHEAWLGSERGVGEQWSGRSTKSDGKDEYCFRFCVYMRPFLSGYLLH